MKKVMLLLAIVGALLGAVSLSASTVQNGLDQFSADSTTQGPVYGPKIKPPPVMPPPWVNGREGER